MRNRVGVAVALACFGLAWPLAAQTITEFPLPTVDGYAWAIAAGPDGNLWFTETNANQIGRITTAGAITEFPIPTADSGLKGITPGPDGSLWFTEFNANQIGRITTAGIVTEFPLPTPDSGPNGIAAGSDGNLWFTDVGGLKICRITTAGVVTEFPIPRTFGRRGFISTNGIAAGPDGNLWVTLGLAHRIGRITTDGVITEFSTPPGGAEGIAAGPDGNMWFTLSFGGIGRITTNGEITAFGLSTIDSVAHAIAAGPDGNMWFIEQGRIGVITLNGVATEISLPSGGYPRGIVAGPDGNVWFTGGSIHRFATGSTSSPCSSDATTLCLNGGRFSVNADWEVPSEGTSGHGTAVRLTPDSGYFWFFGASNVEVVAKVLDGCHGDGGHYWVFAGGLTNVGVTLTITDKQTDQIRTYANPPGTPFQPIQDTSAFDTCP